LKNRLAAILLGYEMFANPQRDITAEQSAEYIKELPG
jgi:galactose-1-phosphate uridylyltransferase